MFKKIFIAIVVFTMCSTGNVWANQLLINDGFENGIVTGWTQSGPNWEGQSTTVFQGAVSAKNVITTIAGFDYFATLKQEFSASAGQIYYATAQAKTIFATQSSARAGVQIDFLNSSNAVIAGSTVKDEIGGNTDWKLLYATKAAPVGTAKVRYSLFVFAPLAESQAGGIALGGAGYFDSAVLSTDFIPPPSVTSLSNDGFENGFSTWTVEGPNWTAQNSIVFEGNLSAKNVISDLGTQTYFSNIKQEINASPGQTWYATLRAKTNINPLSSAVAGLDIEFLNGGTVIGTAVQDRIGGNTDWTQLYVKVTAPAATTKVRFKPIVFATEADSQGPSGPAFGGIAYFDKAVLTTSVINPPSTPIALVNTGFENGLNDWTTPFFPVVADNTDVFAGTLSAKTTIANTPTEDFFSQAYQDMAYLGGTVYASAQVKTNLPAASTAVGAIKIECFNIPNPIATTPNTCANQQNATVTNGWKKVVTSVVPPGGTQVIRVSVLAFAAKTDVFNSNGKIVHFDDVVFSYDPIPGATINTDLINPGFESGLANWNDLFGFPAVADTSTFFSGGVAAKKTIGVAVVGQDYFSQVYQDVYFNAAGVNFPTNTQIWATAQVKTAINPVTLSVGGLLMEFINASGDVIVGASVADTIGGNTDWRKLFVTGNTPAGTQRVRLSGIQYALASEASLGGDTYYDDFVYSVTPLDPVVLNKKLQNTGFENGLTDWDIENQPGTVSNAIKFTGSLAAQFTINNAIINPGINYFGSATQTLDISQNGILILGPRVVNAKMKAKTQINPTTLANAAFRVDFFDENDDFIIGYVSNPIGGNTDWTDLTLENVDVPNNAETLKFTCFLFGPQDNSQIGDKAWFDDASLTIKLKNSKPRVSKPCKVGSPTC
ncbi:MAG: hypothetical protein Q7S13_02305 [Candidatus Omnitrophota bacterium]|nr:hypothetical protein [Candidatus Omnitrophota bacterium]